MSPKIANKISPRNCEDISERLSRPSPQSPRKHGERSPLPKKLERSPLAGKPSEKSPISERSPKHGENKHSERSPTKSSEKSPHKHSDRAPPKHLDKSPPKIRDKLSPKLHNVDEVKRNLDKIIEKSAPAENKEVTVDSNK